MISSATRCTAPALATALLSLTLVPGTAGGSGPGADRAGGPAPGKLLPTTRILDRDRKGCTWVEADASVLFDDDDTPHQAKAKAIAEARAAGMERVLGVTLQHRLIDFQQRNLKGEVGLTETLLRQTQLGRVVDEIVVDHGIRDLADCRGCRYVVRLRSCFAPLPAHNDPDFRVTLGLNRTQFVEGDEAIVRVATSRDAYIYLYSVDVDGVASLLFPDDPATENRLAAGDEFEFPPRKLREAGFRVVAQLPGGAAVSAETIRVVAAKERLPRTTYDPALAAAPSAGMRQSLVKGSGSLYAVLQNLNASGLIWVEDVQAFTIRRREGAP